MQPEYPDLVTGFDSKVTADNGVDVTAAPVGRKSMRRVNRGLRRRLLTRDWFPWLTAACLAVATFILTLTYTLQSGSAVAMQSTEQGANAGYRLSMQATTAEVAGALREKGLPELGSAIGSARTSGRSVPLTVLATDDDEVLRGYGTDSGQPDLARSPNDVPLVLSRHAADSLAAQVGDHLTVSTDAVESTGVVGRIFDSPARPNEATLLLRQRPTSDMSIRWLADDGDLEQIDIDSYGTGIRVTSVQSNTAQTIDNESPRVLALLGRIPLILLAVTLATWWGLLTVGRRRWRTVVEGLLALGVTADRVAKLLTGAVARVAALGCFTGAAAAAAVAWVGAPVMGAVVGQAWDRSIAGHAALSVLSGAGAVDPGVHTWLSRPLSRPGTATALIIVLWVSTWLLTRSVLRPEPTGPAPTSRITMLGQSLASRLRRMPQIARASVAVVPAGLGALLLLGSRQDETGADAAFSTGRIVVSAFLITLGVLATTVVALGMTGRHHALRQVSARWSLATLGTAVAVAVVCAGSSAMLALVAAERADHAADYTADQPTGSLVVSDVNSVAARQIIDGWQTGRGGALAWSLPVAAVSGQQVMTASAQYAECLQRFVGTVYSDVPDDACPYPTNTKSFPLGTTSLSQDPGQATGHPSASAVGVRAEPGIITDGSIGLVTIDVTTGTIQSISLTAAEPVAGLGGTLPSAVVGSDSSVADRLGLVAADVSTVVLPGFAALSPADQAETRAAIAPFTASAAAVIEDHGPGGLDNSGFTGGVVALSALLLMALLASSAGAIVTTSRPTRALATSMGATRAVRWQMSIRAFAALLAASAVGSGASVVALHVTWSGFALSDFGYWWTAPGATATLLVLAATVRMSRPVRRAPDGSMA